MKNLTIEKRVNFKIKDHFTDVDVQIDLPEVDLSKCEISGDWGPHITCPISAQEPIKIKYKNLQNGDEKETVLEDKVLNFISPILKKERDKTPYVVNIVDPYLEKSFTLKFDEEGKCHA